MLEHCCQFKRIYFFIPGYEIFRFFIPAVVEIMAVFEIFGKDLEK